MDVASETDLEHNPNNMVENQIDADDVVDDDRKTERSPDSFDIINTEANDLHHLSEEAEDNTDLLIIDLPEVTLVKVMEYLNLKERYYLSITCKLFFNLFSHPQLWQKAHIDLLCIGHSHKRAYSRWKLKYVMNSTMVEIVKRFSHLFQHLSLNLDDNIQRFDDVSANLLDELRHDCRLESLSLKLGPLTSNDDHIRNIMSIRSNPKDVPLVVGVIHSAFRLKRLNIVSWPLFVDMKDSDILQAIQSNEKLKVLESLSLFFIDIKNQSWTERIPKLPSVQQTLDVISFLSNLTHLALRSPMLSDETILVLASRRRRPLQLLQILVVFAQASMHLAGFQVPEIASSSWQKLTTVSPNLKVELFVLTRVPWEEFRVMLKPGMPLSSLSLLSYSQCDSTLIDCIADHYGSTLRAFLCYCDSSYCDQALMRLVKECSGLKNLAYHGEINYRTVIELAELTKSEKDRWELFQFKERNIKTDSLEEEDEDVVVKYDAVNQKYYLGGIQSWHRDEDRHQNKLDEMIELVRKLLGTSISQNLIVS